MMMKEILLEQLTVSYDQNGWFVALKNAVKNLTAEQAVWKTDGLENSVWEILAHLNYYNFAYLQRFKGIEYAYSKSSNDETFESASDVSEADWQSEIARFEAIMNEWRELITAADETKFAEKIPPKNEAVWWEVLANVMMHNAHHGGQIVVIRKLQGSWDSSKGVS